MMNHLIQNKMKIFISKLKLKSIIKINITKSNPKKNIRNRRNLALLPSSSSQKQIMKNLINLRNRIKIKRKKFNHLNIKIIVKIRIYMMAKLMIMMIRMNNRNLFHKENIKNTLGVIKGINLTNINKIKRKKKNQLINRPILNDLLITYL